LRFTNEQVLNDADSVLRRIRLRLPQTDSAPTCP
jgi:very-short-patch-repair endonuclease